MSPDPRSLKPPTVELTLYWGWLLGAQNPGFCCPNMPAFPSGKKSASLSSALFFIAAVPGVSCIFECSASHVSANQHHPH